MNNSSANILDIKNIEGNNISGSLKAQDLYNFYDHWIIEDKIFMDNLGNYLEKKYEDKNKILKKEIM